MARVKPSYKRSPGPKRVKAGNPAKGTKLPAWRPKFDTFDRAKRVKLPF